MNLQNTRRAVGAFASLALIWYGLWMAWPPLAPVVVGALLWLDQYVRN